MKSATALQKQKRLLKLRRIWNSWVIETQAQKQVKL